MGDTLGLLILGGYYANGRRRGGQISAFLIGVKAPPGAALALGRTAAGGLPLFYPLAKASLLRVAPRKGGGEGNGSGC